MGPDEMLTSPTDEGILGGDHPVSPSCAILWYRRSWVMPPQHSSLPVQSNPEICSRLHLQKTPDR